MTADTRPTPVPRELTCEGGHEPPGRAAERHWRALRLAGELSRLRDDQVGRGRPCCERPGGPDPRLDAALAAAVALVDALYELAAG